VFTAASTAAKNQSVHNTATNNDLPTEGEIAESNFKRPFTQVTAPPASDNAKPVLLNREEVESKGADT
jgi:hypothetical protein